MQARRYSETESLWRFGAIFSEGYNLVNIDRLDRYCLTTKHLGCCMLHELFRKIYLNLNAISALLDGIKKKGKIFRIANWVTRTNYDFFIQIFYSLYLLMILVVWLVDLELCNVKIYPLVHPVTISLSHGKNTFSFCGQCSDNKYANPVTQSKKRHLKYLVRFKNDSWFGLR